MVHYFTNSNPDTNVCCVWMVNDELVSLFMRVIQDFRNWFYVWNVEDVRQHPMSIDIDICGVAGRVFRVKSITSVELLLNETSLYFRWFQVLDHTSAPPLIWEVVPYWNEPQMKDSQKLVAFWEKLLGMQLIRFRSNDSIGE